MFLRAHYPNFASEMVSLVHQCFLLKKFTKTLQLDHVNPVDGHKVWAYNMTDSFALALFNLCYLANTQRISLPVSIYLNGNEPD